MTRFVKERKLDGIFNHFELTSFQNVPPRYIVAGRRRRRRRKRETVSPLLAMWQADQLKLCARPLTRSSRDYASATTAGLNYIFPIFRSFYCLGLEQGCLAPWLVVLFAYPQAYPIL